MHYLIYCDESASDGKFYSDFYGGGILLEKNRQKIEKPLQFCKDKYAVKGEMKWTKVTPYALEAYKEYIDILFSFVKSRQLKIRVMFTQNLNGLTPVAHEKYKHQNKFYRLYFQFLKYCFGLKVGDVSKLSIFMDDLPDKTDDLRIFKSQLATLSKVFPKVQVAAEDIIEINSAKHLILQGIDIVLGAMQFRLNDLHKEKPVGKRCRGKRTRAKEELYKHILKHIRSEIPNFNIGVSTEWGEELPSWELPYAHRNYAVPGEKLQDLSKGKRFRR